MSGSPDRVDVLVTMIDPDLPVPAYEHPGDAGLDLRSRESLRLGPGQRAMVPTGVTLALPPGPDCRGPCHCNLVG